MKTALNIILAAGLGMGLFQASAQGQDKPAFKDDKEKASYAIGQNIGSNIKRSGMELDVEVIANGIKDVLAGKEPRLNEQEAREAIMAYQQAARTKLAEKNKKEGETFLAETKKKPGVKAHTVTTPDGKTGELLYKVITEGSGATPQSNDTVSVNYKGTLINGKEFDSSYKRGQPAKFMVNRVIPGWTAALQLMKVGSKWELYIPAALAYGDNGTPSIEPASTLIFEVELLGIEAPQPAPTPQPLTSDIIKVPSAEELKKGAKVEVLKPEDVERQLRAATNQPSKK